MLCVLVSVAICLLTFTEDAASFSTGRRYTQSSRPSAASSVTRNTPTALAATTVLAPNAIGQSSFVSNELLRLLQQKASAGTNTNKELDIEINSLVRTLIASKSTFDPEVCIDGPLFSTIHFIGKTPLWEKIAVGNVRNVKGQKYTLLDDISGRFVNYAEIWGRDLYLKACGRFVEKGPVPSSNDQEDKTPANPLEMLAAFFSQENQQSKATPFDYEAIVSGASIVLFGKYAFNVDIEGTGTVRVLYADPNLRIFLSPTDTDVTRGAGDWESAGLIVVQVRNDLVYDDWSDQMLYSR